MRRWKNLKRNDVILLIGVTLLFVLVAESMINVPWRDELHDIPTYNNTNASGPGVANSMFNDYSFTIIIIGLLLAAAMIGGVYLAKEEKR